MIEQHRHATGKALLALGIGNRDRLLMFPCPPARSLVHGESVELSTLLVLFPVVSQHAIPVRVVQGKIQQLASRQGQHRGGKRFECVGQALGSRYQVGDLEEQLVALAFRRNLSLELCCVFRHHKPPAPAGRNTAQIRHGAFLSRTGGHRSLPSCGTLVQHCGESQASVPLLGNQSHPPGQEPPQVLLHRFPGLVFLKILLLRLRVKGKIYLRTQTINLGKIP